jgi:hypothetical protein
LTLDAHKEWKITGDELCKKVKLGYLPKLISAYRVVLYLNMTFGQGLVDFY